MNTIILTISNQTATLPIQDGFFQVVINYGSGNINLRLNLSNSNGTGRFHWRGVPNNGINASAVNYAAAFNRDFKNVGGTNNLNATVTGNNIITITSVLGQFISASETSNYAGLSFAVNNQPLVAPIVLTVTQTNTGDCNNINYNITASGGNGIFELRRNSNVLLNGWDGSTQVVQITREVGVSLIRVIDGLGSIVDRSIVSVRKLNASEFNVNQIQLIGSADLSIINTNPVLNTEPIEYSLNGTDYQIDSNFTGILEGDYTLYIKDKFGCVVQKTIVILSFIDPTIENRYDILKASNFNSISYSPITDFRVKKKNYENTLSYSEFVKMPYSFGHKFTTDDIEGLGIGTQFQSSYPFHVITLHKCNGNKVNINSILIQKNLGSTERVDCELIPIPEGIGVFFNGGNSYEPNTSTITGASPHQQFLPDWAELGQFVSIQSLGVKEIIGFGYAIDLDRQYFIVSGVLSASNSDIVQVKYDVQKYNILEFYLNPNDLNNKGFLTIEAGYEFNQIDKSLVSEPIELIEDSQELLKIEWSGFKNMGDMVFVSGITGIMRIEGKIRAYPKGDSELSETDTGSYPLSQKSTMGQRVLIPLTTPKLWDKINDISGISLGGNLFINGLELVRNKAIEIEEQGDSNVSEVTIDFDYSSNSLAIKSNEIVLNVSTGVIGGGSGIDDDLIILDYDGLTRLVDVDGNFIMVGSNYIAV